MGNIRFGLIENAEESLNHCVQHIIGQGNASHWDLKRGILDAVHVIELILKEQLRRNNEALIWEDIDRYPQIEARKVGIEKTVQRLQSIAKMDLDRNDLEDIQCAAKIRNKFIHYEIELEEKGLKSLLGRLLAFIFRFSEQHMEKDLSEPFKRDDTWKKIVFLIGLWPAYSITITQGLYAAEHPGIIAQSEKVTGVDQHVKQARELVGNMYYVFNKRNIGTITISVLRDVRLKARNGVVGMNVNEMGIGKEENMPTYLNAVITLSDENGKELDRMILEKPLAELKDVDVEGKTKTYILEVDYSIGVGSYNGPIYSLLSVNKNRLEMIKAWDEKSKKSREIHMMSSLKTAWKIVDKKTILEIACRPDFEKEKKSENELEFMIIYTRYSWDGERWVLHTKTVPGFWEDEGEFPERALFP